MSCYGTICLELDSRPHSIGKRRVLSRTSLGSVFFLVGFTDRTHVIQNIGEIDTLLGHGEECIIRTSRKPPINTRDTCQLVIPRLPYLGAEEEGEK
ncbi:hypothetical protein VTK26DRAFT_2348 [Humicola hyalothermophila]